MKRYADEVLVTDIFAAREKDPGDIHAAMLVKAMQAEGVPIYQQIIRYVKQGIAAGTIRDGEELPSRRVLSALLAVNPNTVQKAYRMMEEEGLVESHTGAKSCVHADAGRVAALRQELTETELRAMVRSMKRMGLDRQSAWSLFERLYAEEETE